MHRQSFQALVGKQERLGELLVPPIGCSRFEPGAHIAAGAISLIFSICCRESVIAPEAAAGLGESR